MASLTSKTFGIHLSKPRQGALKGQASAEFIVVVPIFLFIVFFILWAGFAMFERSTLVQRFSTLGSELPAGWEAMADDVLVKNLIMEDGVLDDAALTVLNASVTVPPPLVHTEDGDDVATALGKTKSKVETAFVKVEADISYAYRGILSWSGPQTLTGHVERTYMIGQKYEIL